MLTVNENYRLKKMAEKVKDAHSVLDIGFSDKPNPYLANESVIGIDIQHTNKPENYSRIFFGLIEDYVKQSDNKVDAILAGEIIEHLENPLHFLGACHSALKHGGSLVISTPNPNSFIERVLTLTLSRKFFYTEDHLYIFPQRWLIRLVEYSGFTNVSLISGGFPLPFFGTIPFPRPWCHQTILVAQKK